MAVLPIITVPNPLLRQKSKPVGKIDKKVLAIITDLTDTVKALKEIKGVGLSAVQIGYLSRIFVIQQGTKFVPFVNPEIIATSKTMFSDKFPKKHQFLEGCLSIPSYYGFVNRHYQITLRWQSPEGQTNQADFSAKQASYLQHEYDHLEGILFADRILTQHGQIYQVEKTPAGKEELVEVNLQ